MPLCSCCHMVLTVLILCFISALRIHVLHHSYVRGLPGAGFVLGARPLMGPLHLLHLLCPLAFSFEINPLLFGTDVLSFTRLDGGGLVGDAFLGEVAAFLHRKGLSSTLGLGIRFG